MISQLLYNVFLFTLGFMILAPWPVLSPHLCGMLGLFAGFAAWSILSIVIFVLRVPYVLPVMLLACLALVAIGITLQKSTLKERGFLRQRVTWFAVYLVVFVAVSIAASTTCYLFFTPDSYVYIAGAGALIEQSGSLQPPNCGPELVATMASAGPIALAALWAGSRLFGVEFWYSCVPIAAFWFLAAFTRLTFMDLASTVQQRRQRIILALLASALLLSVPSFLYNSHYLHSNLLTGFFYAFSLVGVSLYRQERTRFWLVFSAVSLSFCLLLRTEMVQYAAIPVALAIGTHGIRKEEYLAFLLPLLSVGVMSQVLKTMAGHSGHDPNTIQWGFLGIYALSYVIIHLRWTKVNLAPLVPRAAATLLVLIVLYSLFFNHGGMVRSLSGLLHVVSYREGLLEGGAWGGIWLFIAACAVLNATFVHSRSFRLYGFALIVYFTVRALIYSLPFFPNVEINQYNSGARILFHILPVAIIGSVHILGASLGSFSALIDTAESSESPGPP